MIESVLPRRGLLKNLRIQQGDRREACTDSFGEWDEDSFLASTRIDWIGIRYPRVLTRFHRCPLVTLWARTVATKPSCVRD